MFCINAKVHAVKANGKEAGAYADLTVYMVDVCKGLVVTPASMGSDMCV